MKQLAKKVFVWMLSCLLIVSSLPPLPAQAAAKNRSANIYSFTGTVSVKRGGDKKLKAFEGMRLEAGDIIITESSSSAVIAIDTDKSITVDANTEIALDELSGTAKKSKTGTSLFSGNVVNNVREKLTDGSTYETKTSNAVMGVRGTSYLVGQDSDGVQLLVASGTVAFGHDTEPVLVPAGSGSKCSGTQGVEPPHAIHSEDVLSLTPIAAKDFVTETLLLGISDKTTGLDSLDHLIGQLEKQQSERIQKVQDQIRQKQETISQQTIEEPEPFLSDPANTLTGATDILLTPDPAPAPVKEAEVPQAPQQNIPEPKQAPVPSSNAPEKPQTKENDIPKEQNTPPSPSTTGKNQDSGGNGGNGNADSGGSSGGGNPGTDIPGNGSGSGNPGNGGGSDSGNSGNGSGSGGSGGGSGTKPETKPEVSVGELHQDAIYEEDSSGNLSQLYAMAVTWNQHQDASDYLIQIKKTDGTTWTTRYSDQPAIASANKCRLLLTAQTRAQFDRGVLTVTPVTAFSKIPKISSIQLDYSLPASSDIRKLGKPDTSGISLDYSTDSITFQFETTAGVSGYRGSVYFNNSATPAYTQDFRARASYGTFQFPRNGFSGTAYITIQALGDGFTTFSSDVVSSPEFSIIGQGKLQTPQATFVTSGQKKMIQWPANYQASGYELELYGENGHLTITTGHTQPYGIFIYTLLPRDMEYLSMVRVRWVSSNSRYGNSDWCYVDIPDFNAGTASPSNAKMASPSNASPASLSRVWDTDDAEEDGEDIEIELVNDLLWKEDE